MSDSKTYSDYLTTRSFKGGLYRRWYLYPILSRFLTGNVLDYGCGIGDFLAYRTNTIGVDINCHNVAICLQRGLDALVIDKKRLPFENEYSSNLIMDNVLEHIAPNEAGETLQELIRVTAAQGYLVIGVPGIKAYTSDKDHRCYYSERDLVALMSTFSCPHVCTLHLPFKFPFLSNFLRQYCIYGVFRRP